MTQNERLDYLVEEFKTDSVRYKDLTTPSDTEGKRQLYTNIYDLAAALVDTADCLNYDVGYLIGDEIDELDIEDALFNPADM